VPKPILNNAKPVSRISVSKGRSAIKPVIMVRHSDMPMINIEVISTGTLSLPRSVVDESLLRGNV
jgi:hypothetical protein